MRALGEGRLQHLCLNQVVVQDEAGWLGGMAAALSSVDAPSRVGRKQPILELSQVRVSQEGGAGDGEEGGGRGCSLGVQWGWGDGRLARGGSGWLA